MLFKDFALYLEKLEGTPSRLVMTDILADLLSKLSIEESEIGVYLMLGGLAAEFESVEFNMAEKMVIRSIARVLNQEIEVVAKKYRKLGDLGEVIKRDGENKKNNLTIEAVGRRLKEIAEDEGEASQERKIDALSNLLSEVDGLSAKFIVRIVLSKLRLGFSAKTIIDALSVMSVGNKSARKDIERVYQVLPDAGRLVRQIKSLGLSEMIKKVVPIIGIPVNPMLCQRIKSPKEMVEKMGKVAIEPKFDGTRVQIHFKRGEKSMVKTFTRNLKETSWMFPELKQAGKWFKADEVILDSEAVGLDEERKAVVNFQTTMQRRRKHNIENFSNKVPIRFCVFDVIYKDGESLMDLPYYQRRKILEETVISNELFQVDEYEVTEEVEMIAKFHKEMLLEGLEGIVVKQYSSKYVPGRTGWRWVKMKEEEKSVAKLSDTVDGIVMGYSTGKGKRAEFGVGRFLVGIRDGDKIKTVTKVGTGLTDEQFRELKRRLDKLTINEQPKEYVVGKTLMPEVWVKPSLVVELAADEITKSSVHTAGVALRFPRLVRFRDDKGVEESTTTDELKEIAGQ